MLAIRLSEDIEKRLQHLATKTGRTKTYYAREAILEFLEDMEDRYLALHRLEHPQTTYTQEQIEAEIDLAN